MRRSTCAASSGLWPNPCKASRQVEVPCAFGATPALAQEKILRIAMTASDIPTTSGMLNNGFESTDEAAMLKYYAASHERLVDNPPWLYIVHDLNPRAFSRKVKGFVSPQSWFADLTLVSLD